MRNIVGSLNSEETRVLQHEAPPKYQAQLSDVLLTALAQTLTRWSGHEGILIHSEGPGRETILEGVDLTRTVGWFADLFPTLLILKHEQSPGEALKSIKEQLRQVPNWGTGYGLLRYLSDDPSIRETLRSFPQPDVYVSFQPPADNKTTAPSFFELVTRTGAAGVDSHEMRSGVFQIKVSDAGGCLRSEWTYNENLHRRETVQHLADEFLEALRALIAHSALPDAEGYTPSDFPLAALNEEKFRKLSSLLGETDD